MSKPCATILLLHAMFGGAANAEEPAETDERDSQRVSLAASSAWSSPAQSNGPGDLADDMARAKRGEWIIAPIPFKSALLGSGLKLGVGRMYFKDAGAAKPHPSMFGAGGMYTENGGWAAALMDRRYWARETWRSTAAVADGEIKYSLQLGDFPDADVEVEQGFKGVMFALDRNFANHAWVGAGIIAGKSPLRITDLPGDLPGLQPSLTYKSVTVNLNAEWDTRDDSFYPSAGIYLDFTAGMSRSSVGSSDDEYASYSLAMNRYYGVGERSVLAVRAFLQTVDGDAPFFALPWFGSGADLRGYTPGRFIGQSLAAAQAEWRVKVGKRLGFVVFAGAGGVFGEVQNFEQEDFLPAGGVGARFRLTKKDTVNFRVDYAWGRDDNSLTISVGEAF
jgi:hypothetical protein